MALSYVCGLVVGSVQGAAMPFVFFSSFKLIASFLSTRLRPGVALIASSWLAAFVTLIMLILPALFGSYIQQWKEYLFASLVGWMAGGLGSSIYRSYRHGDVRASNTEDRNKGLR